MSNMRNRIVLVAVLALTVFAVAAAFADASSLPEVTGAIAAVNNHGNSMQITTGKGKELVYFSKSTKFLQADKAIASTDLKTGMMVKVNYLVQGSSKQAIQVQVTAGGAQ